MADRYWVGGTATWDATAGTKWATTSGGSGGSAVPTSADNVYFDAASGAVTVTVSGTRALGSLNMTGFTGTMAGTTTPILTVSGTVCTFGSGMTMASTGPLIRSASAVSAALTTNGIVLRNLEVVTTSCTWTLQDNLSVAGTITVNAGTFDANDFNVTASGFASSAAGVRVINMGNGTWTLNGASTLALWNMTTISNATVNVEGSTLLFSPTLTGNNTIIAGVKLDNPITIAPRPVTHSRVQLQGAGVGGYGNLTVEGPNTIQAAGNLVIDNANLKGTPTGQIMFESSALGTPRTITVSGAIVGQYAAVKDLVKAGAGTVKLSASLNLNAIAGIDVFPGTPVSQSAIGI